MCSAQVNCPVSSEPAPPTLPDPGPKGVSRAARSLVPSGPGSVAWPGLRPSGWGGKAEGPRHSPGAVGFRAVRTEGCRPSTAAGGLGHGFMLSLQCLGRGHRVGWGLVGPAAGGTRGLRGKTPVLPAAVTGVGFCPPAWAPLSTRLACPGSLRRPAAPGPEEEGVPPTLPLLVAPRLGLSWVALTGPCVRSAGSRRAFPRPGPPPPGQVGHEQGSWPRPAQPLGAECCEECAPSAGKGQS